MSYIAPTADPSELYFEPPSGYIAPTTDPSELYFEPVTTADEWTGYTGEDATAQLQTSSRLRSQNYTGETATSSLAVSTRFALGAETGETFDAIVTLAQAAYLQPVSYTGETFNSSLSIIARFNLLAYTGETLNSALTTFPAAYLQPVSYTGESGSAALTTSTVFTLLCATGETAICDLRTGPAAYLQPVSYTGESGSAALTTSTVFTLLCATGETAICDLRTGPAAYLAADAYLGQTFTTVVNSAGERFSPLAYAGESLSCILTNAPSLEIALTSYTGESFTSAIAFAQQLGSFVLFDGSAANFATLGENSLIRAYNGTVAVVSLAVDITLPLNFFEGAAGSSALKTGPSEGIGSLRTYTGEDFNAVDVKVAISKHFAVLFRNSFVTRADIDSETDFDLISDAGCCGPTDDRSGKRIDLGDAPLPGWTWSGYKQVFKVDLQTRPRFAFTAYTGTELTLKDYSAYFTFDFGNGATGKVESFDAVENIRLCRPNFIPDGDNVVTELDTVYDENCSSDWARTGETLRCSLSVIKGPEPRPSTGETFFFDFVVNAPWQAIAYAGQFAYVNNPEFSPRFRCGESLLPKLYEDAFLAYDGAALLSPNLVTEYSVEFLEVGCFENEFIPLNEFGGPILDLFNSVPVELDFYQHEVRARCF